MVFEGQKRSQNLDQGTASYELYLMGDYTFYYNGEEKKVPSSKNVLILLTLLCANSNQSFYRNYLASLFWPESGIETAKANLRKLLYTINKALPNLLNTESDRIKLNESISIWSDVGFFLSQSKELLRLPINSETYKQELMECINLYQDDFLLGHDESIVTNLLKILKSRYENCIFQLLQVEKVIGNPTTALEYALILGDLDPYRERYCQEILRLYMQLQKYGQAREYFEAYQKFLDDELGEEPTLETWQLVFPVGVMESSVSQNKILVIDQIPIIGREYELERILNHLSPALCTGDRAEGMPNAVFIEGPEGIGKTRVVEEAKSEFEWRNITVLKISPQDIQWARPYQFIRKLILQGVTDNLLLKICNVMNPESVSVLKNIIPEIESGNEQQSSQSIVPDQHQILLASSEFLRLWEQISPLLILVEDLQWFDADSYNLCNELLPFLNGVRIGFIFTYRSQELRVNNILSRILQQMKSKTLSLALKLKPLNIWHAESLVKTSLNTKEIPPGLSEVLINLSSGNPRSMLNAIMDFHRRNILRLSKKGQWKFLYQHSQIAEETSNKNSVLEFLDERLNQLSPSHRNILKVAALFDGSFDGYLVSRTLEEKEYEIEDDLITLCQWKFFKETDRGYLWCDQSLKKGVLLTLRSEEKKQLHSKIFRVLKNRVSSNVQELAIQSFDAELWNDAISFGIRAAEASFRRFAYEKSLQHCDRVISLIASGLAENAPYETKFSIYSIRQELYYRMGQRDKQDGDISELLSCAEECPENSYRVMAYKLRADYCYKVCHDFDEAIQVSKMALDLIAEESSMIKAELWTIIGNCHRLKNESEEAELAFQNSISMYTAIGAPLENLLLIHANLAYVYESNGFHDQLFASIEFLEQNLVHGRNPVILGKVYQVLGMAAHINGNYDEYFDNYNKALVHFKASGIMDLEGEALFNIGLVHLSMHHYQESYDTMMEAFQLFQQCGNNKFLIQSTYNLAVFHYSIGLFDRALELLFECLRLLKNHHLPYWQGIAESVVSLIYLELEDFQKSNLYLNKLKKTNAGTSAASLNLRIHFIQGRIMLGMGKVRKSMFHFQNMLDESKQQQNIVMQATASSFLGFGYLEEGKVKKAYQYSLNAVESIQKINSAEDMQFVFYHHYLILNILGKSGEAQQSLIKAFEILKDIQDSIKNPHWKRSYIENDHFNSSIYREYERLQTEQKENGTIVRLAKTVLPGHSKLKEDEWIQVRWTPVADSDMQIANKVDRRRSSLLRILGEAEMQGGVPTQEDLAAALKVSVRTIKSDLASLRDQGYAVKTRGMALSY
jgi:DNA-binding SARP family transcriptional activator/tetratricopeptide (TPR) repeat protein/Cdc6-like AAA superfamily ATPase